MDMLRNMGGHNIDWCYKAKVLKFKPMLIPLHLNMYNMLISEDNFKIRIQIQEKLLNSFSLYVLPFSKPL